MLQKYVKISAYLCYHGGIGIRTGFKILREKSHVSSSLTDSIVNLLVGVEWFRCLKWSIRRLRWVLKDLLAKL